MMTPGTEYSPPSFDGGSFGVGTPISQRIPLPLIRPHQTCDVTQPIIGICMPKEILLMRMQEYLTSQEFEWFHPDDFTLVSRRSSDMVYVVFKLEIGAENSINMNVSFQHALQETLQSMLEGITWIITQTDQQLRTMM